MRSLVLLTALLATVAQSLRLSHPGLHFYGKKTVHLKSGSAASLFYPALRDGEDTPFDASRAPYPAITFAPGNLRHLERYDSLLQHLASWGFFVIAPHFGSMNTLPFVEHLSSSLDYFDSQNTHRDSQLFGRIRTDRYGLAGHSMGAGAGVLLAARDPRIKALTLLEAVDVFPSAISRLVDVYTPTQFLTSEDWALIRGTGTEGMYNASHVPRKMHFITGGSSSFFFDGPGKRRKHQLGIVRNLVTSFFTLHLAGEKNMWPYVWGDRLISMDQVKTTMDYGNPSRWPKRPGYSAAFSPESVLQLVSEESSTHFVNGSGLPSVGFRYAMVHPRARPGADGSPAPARNRRPFRAVLMYPATDAAEDASLADPEVAAAAVSGSSSSSTPPPSGGDAFGEAAGARVRSKTYPVVVFCVGTLVAPEKYASMAARIAAAGYVVIGSTDRMSTINPASVLARQMHLLVRYAGHLSHHGRGQSDMFGKLDMSRVAFLGTGYGAAAALLAASKATPAYPISAVLLVGADMHVPTGEAEGKDGIASFSGAVIAAASSLPASTAKLFLSGSSKFVAPIKNNSYPLYQACHPPKVLHALPGVSNALYAESHALMNSAKSVEDAAALSGSLIIDFLSLYVKRDPASWPAVWGPTEFEASQVVTLNDPGFGLVPQYQEKTKSFWSLVEEEKQKRRRLIVSAAAAAAAANISRSGRSNRSNSSSSGNGTAGGNGTAAAAVAAAAAAAASHSEMPPLSSKELARLASGPGMRCTFDVTARNPSLTDEIEFVLTSTTMDIIDVVDDSGKSHLAAAAAAAAGEERHKGSSAGAAVRAVDDPTAHLSKPASEAFEGVAAGGVAAGVAQAGDDEDGAVSMLLQEGEAVAFTPVQQTEGRGGGGNGSSSGSGDSAASSLPSDEAFASVESKPISSAEVVLLGPNRSATITVAIPTPREVSEDSVEAVADDLKRTAYLEMHVSGSAGLTRSVSMFRCIYLPATPPVPDYLQPRHSPGAAVRGFALPSSRGKAAGATAEVATKLGDALPSDVAQAAVLKAQQQAIRMVTVRPEL